MWLRSQGLRVMPPSTDSVNGHWPNSGIRVLPTTTAPACRSRRTISPSRAAAAEAVTQAGACGETAVVGLATPNAMRPYVQSGCVKSVVLWSPVDLGYAAVYVMRAVVDGKLAPGGTDVEAGRLGKLQVVNGSEILLGSPYVFNSENVDDFDF